MAIGGIGPNLGTLGLGGAHAAGGPAVDKGTDAGNGAAGGFAQILAGLNGTSSVADRAVTRLATGQDNDLHDVMLSVESEGLAFDLAVQIRNRLVDAYSEIFRMQV
ncbi:MAG: flagellar hook-basal body complex protein FliE [Dehalococcoidia bacterium]|nr:MAG: flagellar hook-basal body complex protein FliE [Dehalococcoidia bacterium]